MNLRHKADVVRRYGQISKTVVHYLEPVPSGYQCGCGAYIKILQKSSGVLPMNKRCACGRMAQWVTYVVEDSKQTYEAYFPSLVEVLKLWHKRGGGALVEHTLLGGLILKLKKD